MLSETWLPAIGYPGYQVSDLGRVRSHKGKSVFLLTEKYSAAGRAQVRLYTKDGRKTIQVSVLIAEAFLGPKPEGLWCLHRDDDKRNNCVSNLYWGTPSDNSNDAYANGRRVGPKRKLTDDQVRLIRDSSESCLKLGKQFNVSPRTISRVKARQSYKEVS